MDSDDISLPDRFEKQLRIFENNPELDILGGAIAYFSDSPDTVFAYWYPPQSDSEIKEAIKRQSPFNHVTVMFKKSSVLAAGGYVEWFCEEDYYLWARMIKNNCKMANLHDTLVYVRTSPEQMARRGGRKYFSSELKMHTYLFKNGFIGLFRYIYNVAVRFGVEIICTPKMRLWLRKKFIWKIK